MNALLILQFVSFWLNFVNKWKVGLGNNCPDPDGGHVSWWILYQQKSMPFLHFYADSRNNQEIKVTFALHDFVANLSLKLNMTQTPSPSISVNPIAYLTLINKESCSVRSIRYLRFCEFNGILFPFYEHFLGNARPVYLILLAPWIGISTYYLLISAQPSDTQMKDIHVCPNMQDLYSDLNCQEVYGVYIGIEGIAERKNMAENAFTQVMFSFNA